MDKVKLPGVNKQGTGLGMGRLGTASEACAWLASQAAAAAVASPQRKHRTLAAAQSQPARQMRMETPKGTPKGSPSTSKQRLSRPRNGPNEPDVHPRKHRRLSSPIQGSHLAPDTAPCVSSRRTHLSRPDPGHHPRTEKHARPHGCMFSTPRQIPPRSPPCCTPFRPNPPPGMASGPSLSGACPLLAPIAAAPSRPQPLPAAHPHQSAQYLPGVSRSSLPAHLPAISYQCPSSHHLFIIRPPQIPFIPS